MARSRQRLKSRLVFPFPAIPLDDFPGAGRSRHHDIAHDANIRGGLLLREKRKNVAKLGPVALPVWRRRRIDEQPRVVNQDDVVGAVRVNGLQLSHQRAFEVA